MEEDIHSFHMTPNTQTFISEIVLFWAESHPKWALPRKIFPQMRIFQLKNVISFLCKITATRPTALLQVKRPQNFAFRTHEQRLDAQRANSFAKALKGQKQTDVGARWATE